MYSIFLYNFLSNLFRSSDRFYEKDFLLNKLYEIKRLSEDSLFDNSLPIQNIQNLIMAARKYNFHAVLFTFFLQEGTYIQYT